MIDFQEKSIILQTRKGTDVENAQYHVISALNMRVPYTVHIAKEQMIRQIPTIIWDSSNTHTETKYDYEPGTTVTGG